MTIIKCWSFSAVLCQRRVKVKQKKTRFYICVMLKKVGEVLSCLWSVLLASDRRVITNHIINHSSFSQFTVQIFSIIYFLSIVLLSVTCPTVKMGPTSWTRTRGSNVGQRCVGVRGRCQFATTSPALSAALFASKGSNIYGLVPEIQTSATSSTSSVTIRVQFSRFVVPDFELASPSRSYSKSRHGKHTTMISILV